MDFPSHEWLNSAWLSRCPQHTGPFTSSYPFIFPSILHLASKSLFPFEATLNFHEKFQGSHLPLSQRSQTTEVWNPNHVPKSAFCSSKIPSDSCHTEVFYRSDSRLPTSKFVNISILVLLTSNNTENQSPPSLDSPFYHMIHRHSQRCKPGMSSSPNVSRQRVQSCPRHEKKMQFFNRSNCCCCPTVLETLRTRGNLFPELF